MVGARWREALPRRQGTLQGLLRLLGPAGAVRLRQQRRRAPGRDRAPPRRQAARACSRWTRASTARPTAGKTTMPAGRLVKVGTARQGRGPDNWTFPGPGEQPSRREYDNDGDGRIEKAEVYSAGRVAARRAGRRRPRCVPPLAELVAAATWTPRELTPTATGPRRPAARATGRGAASAVERVIPRSERRALPRAHRFVRPRVADCGAAGAPAGGPAPLAFWGRAWRAPGCRCWWWPSRWAALCWLRARAAPVTAPAWSPCPAPRLLIALHGPGPAPARAAAAARALRAAEPGLVRVPQRPPGRCRSPPGRRSA